ncbi:hypothetical protein ADL27_48615, partial [Streptomyces sp. NRRL F-6602]
MSEPFPGRLSAMVHERDIGACAAVALTAATTWAVVGGTSLVREARLIGAALEDVRKGHAGPVPTHLRDGHYKGAAKLGHAQGYIYPHDVPGAIAAQQYAPDALAGKRYYQPT